MAASSSQAAPILLLVLLLPAAVLSPARAAGLGHVKKFCAKADNAEACTHALLAYPESRTASARRLTELLLLSASWKASADNVAIQARVMAMKQPPQYCIQSCVDDVNFAAMRLASLMPSPASAVPDTSKFTNFTEAKWFLKGGVILAPTNCGQCASSVPLTDEETAITEQGYRLWNELLTAARNVLSVSPMPKVAEAGSKPQQP